MVSSLLKNGVHFCDVLEDRTIVHGAETGTFMIVTSQRISPWPGDVFEIVGREIRYRVDIVESRIGIDGWDTLCSLAPAK
jgi:hypothetical protein